MGELPSDDLGSHALVLEQVETVVRQFGVISYMHQLRPRLPPDTLRTHGTDEVLIELLRRCAVLVAGNWVLKSELAGFEGLNAHARDILLVLLTKTAGRLNENLYRSWEQTFEKEVPKSIQAEITRGLADQVRRDAGWFWMLKNGQDVEFMRKFPAVVKEYDAFWDHRKREIVILNSSPPTDQKEEVKPADTHRSSPPSRLTDAHTEPAISCTHSADPGVDESMVGGQPSATDTRDEALRDWLMRLDNGKGALLQYFEVLQHEFDADFGQLAAARLEEPSGPSVTDTIDPNFWDTCGIKQTGHRMLIARGINALCSSQAQGTGF